MLVACLAVALALAGRRCNADSSAQPDIVFILADDPGTWKTQERKLKLQEVDLRTRHRIGQRVPLCCAVIATPEGGQADYKSVRKLTMPHLSTAFATPDLQPLREIQIPLPRLRHSVNRDECSCTSTPLLLTQFSGVVTLSSDSEKTTVS